MVPTGRRSGGLGRSAGVRVGAAAGLSGPVEAAGAVPVSAQVAVSAPAASKAVATAASATRRQRGPPEEYPWRPAGAGESGRAFWFTAAGYRHPHYLTKLKPAHCLINFKRLTKS